MCILKGMMYLDKSNVNLSKIGTALTPIFMRMHRIGMSEREMQAFSANLQDLVHASLDSAIAACYAQDATGDAVIKGLLEDFKEWLGVMDHLLKAGEVARARGYISRVQAGCEAGLALVATGENLLSVKDCLTAMGAAGGERKDGEQPGERDGH